MNTRIFLLLVLALMICQSSTIQAQTKELNLAKKAFAMGDYYTAAYYFKTVFSGSKTKIKGTKLVDAQFKYAEASRKTYSYLRAEQFYGDVAKGPFVDKYPSARYYYALSMKRNGNYKTAISQFNDFINQSTEDKEVQLLQNKAARDLEGCILAMKFIENPDKDVKIIHLGSEVNTKYSDFSPHMVGDTMYYSSLRFEREMTRGRYSAGSNGSKNLVGKILISKNEGNTRYVELKNENLNKKYENSGNSNVSPDGNRLYFCKCALNREEEMICQIYVSAKDKNGKWGESVKLPDHINTPEFTTTHPAIGYDSVSKREILFFVSDREGGIGGMDIYMSEIDGENYGRPLNAGRTINTVGDEVSPFFHNDKQTLYFSSDYMPGMGGFDIFYSTYQKGDFNAPHNIGVPLNSAANDLYFIINPGDTSGFFSSNRPGSQILTGEACCNDIYKIILPALPIEKENVELDSAETELIVEQIIETKEEEIVATETPVEETQETEEVVPVKVRRTLDALNDLLPLSLYFHNNEPRDLKTNYTSTIDDYLDMIPTYKSKHLSQYNVSVKDQFEEQLDDFFTNDVQGNFDKMHLFFDELIIAMQEGYKLEVSIQGFTSPRASVEYNKLLSHRRINSVLLDMLNYKSGALKPFIETKQLVVHELPLGEGKAPNHVSDDLNDERNSIYSVGASSQRKVNFTVVHLLD